MKHEVVPSRTSQCSRRGSDVFLCLRNKETSKNTSDLLLAIKNMQKNIENHEIIRNPCMIIDPFLNKSVSIGFQAIHWDQKPQRLQLLPRCLLQSQGISCNNGTWVKQSNTLNTRHFMFTRFSPHKQRCSFFSKPCLCQQQLRQPLLQQPHLKAKETENPNWKWFETSALYHQWDIHGLFNNLFDVLESGLTTSDFMNIPRRSILSATKTSCPPTRLGAFPYGRRHIWNFSQSFFPWRRIVPSFLIVVALQRQSQQNGRKARKQIWQYLVIQSSILRNNLIWAIQLIPYTYPDLDMLLMISQSALVQLRFLFLSVVVFPWSWRASIPAAEFNYRTKSRAK